MNKAKKLVISLLILGLITGFSGCKASENVVENTTTTTQKVTQTTTEITTENTTKKVVEETTKNETSTAQTTTKKVEKTTEKTTKNQAKSTTKKAKETTTKSIKADSVKVSIQCKEILENMDDLAKGHNDFVPNNGVILSSFSCDFNGNITAYDALKTACEKNNIKLTTKNTGYGIYVVGINNLDEFDCGKYSGWKYKVNGVEPNKACDKYQLSKGDRVEFFYVCTY